MPLDPLPRFVRGTLTEALKETRPLGIKSVEGVRVALRRKDAKVWQIVDRIDRRKRREQERNERISNRLASRFAQ